MNSPKNGDLNSLRQPKVMIVILNWNGKDDTIVCLDSLSKLDYTNYEVIVVDNGSTDGSQKEIKRRFPMVKLVENKENLGFAKGNNIGIRIALEDSNVKYIFLLNNDTKVEPNCLTELIKVAETDGRIGIVQPKMLRMNDPRIIDSTGHVFSWGRIVDRGCGKVDKGQYDCKLDIIGGCAGACLYRREMLEEIGLFDESFWAYYEDAELSWRAYKRGWKAKYVPSAIVYHKRGATTNKCEEITLKMALLNIKNMATTVNRYGTPLQKFLFSTYLMYTGIKSAIGKCIGKNKIGGKPYFEAIKILVR